MPGISKFGETAELERVRVSIVGCGGAGCNMLHEIPPIPGYEPIALNDEPHPSMIGIGRRIFVSKEGLKGIAETEKRGRRELYTDVEKTIEREVEGSDIVFIISGLGGYTGTWAAPIVASVAHHCKALAVSLVSLPFTVEGIARRALADEGLSILRKCSDVAITFSNDELLKLAPNIPLLRAFQVMGRLVGKPIANLASVLTRGDIPHLKSVLRRIDEMRVGMGEGTGDHRNFVAVEDTFTSPWFDFDLSGVKEVVLFLSSQYIDPKDVDEIIHDVSLRTPNANITWGSMEEDIGEKTRVSVLLGV
ncbi:MAG: hypothetical protein ACE5QW_04135 [Thermoplasmata archaeon]